MKNSTENIENLTRDFPAWSAVPQQTAPPRTPIYVYVYICVYVHVRIRE
jgi:hypothetical protein